MYGNGNYLDRIRPLVISVSDLLLNKYLCGRFSPDTRALSSALRKVLFRALARVLMRPYRGS